MTEYLSVAEVLAIHTDQIDLYGGRDGILDLGQLAAALFRPQTAYYRDLVEEAAALWAGLSENHSFVEGNQRTAFAATYTFLIINGRRLNATGEAIYAFLSKFPAKRNDVRSSRFDAHLAWLREHVE